MNSPYTIKVKDLSKCIICHSTVLDNGSYDLSINNYCSCRFNYHAQCYEQWINLTKNENCLMCRQDISFNYIHLKPFYIDNSRNISITSFATIDIRYMSPRTRYLAGVPFMYEPRPITNLDRFSNYICCKKIQRPNAYVNEMVDNLDIIILVICVFLTFVGVATVIIILTDNSH
jgi:hypothetical protein|uniref:Uncharacterized protein n=1 Tax=viral metagenome TaxID=1070528 RepID=A0A6C0IR00_9ZZZZ